MIALPSFITLIRIDDGDYQRLEFELEKERLLLGLSSFGLASFTLIARPSTVAPSSSAIAFLAASSSDISTKPKPLLRLVNLSVITFAEVTSPYSLKYSLRSSSCTAKLKFET